MHQVTRGFGALLAAATLSTTVLVVGVGTPASAATTTDMTTCAELWDVLPTALRQDLRAARSLPPVPQRRAMRAIRFAALRGVYGEDVERLAEERRERRRELWAEFPQQLKDDILAARSLPWDEQRRAMRTVRESALGGGYGEEVQALAAVRAQWLSTCPKVVEAL